MDIHASKSVSSTAAGAASETHAQNKAFMSMHASKGGSSAFACTAGMVLQIGALLRLCLQQSPPARRGHKEVGSPADATACNPYIARNPLQCGQTSSTFPGLFVHFDSYTFKLITARLY
eukprot:1136205-Pelagomonas_calceolata.AAC.2